VVEERAVAPGPRLQICAIARGGGAPMMADMTMLKSRRRRGPEDNLMLILSRRIGEALRIDDEITITVFNVQGGQVRFGIAAPRHIEVHREEVRDRINAANPRRQGAELAE
jgi:carbon storage regulator